MMYNEKIEALISAALADGVLTEKEKQVLFKKAQSEGIDLDEFEMVLDARLIELEKAEKEKAEKSAPKSTKYGDVRKCPVCGALVPALAGSCPECGYEFSGIEVSKSAKVLADKLSAVNSKWGANLDEKIEIIENFPIPNTKVDLIGFLIMAKPHILDSKDPLARAYFKKYQQCLEQAKILLPNDKILLPYIQEYDMLKKRINSFSYTWNALLRKWNAIDDFIKWFIIMPIFGVILCVIIGFVWHYAATADERYEESIIQAVNVGDIDKALKMYELGSQKYANEYGWGEKSSQIIFTNVLKKDVKEAEQLLVKYQLREGFRNNFKKELRNEYLNQGFIDDYWRISCDLYNEGSDHRDRYSAMEEVVKFYCKKGDIGTAKAFVDKNINWFYVNVDKDPLINKEGGLFETGHADWKPYKKSRVQERLNEIINQYK